KNFERRICSGGGCAVDSLKRGDGQRQFIGEKSEILLLQAANGRARLVGHLHVERNSPVRSVCRDFLRFGSPGLKLRLRRRIILRECAAERERQKQNS